VASARQEIADRHVTAGPAPLAFTSPGLANYQNVRGHPCRALLKYHFADGDLVEDNGRKASICVFAHRPIWEGCRSRWLSVIRDAW
jgi:hypothetical protein